MPFQCVGGGEEGAVVEVEAVVTTVVVVEGFARGGLELKKDHT